MTDEVTYPKDLTNEQRAALPEFVFCACEEFPYFKGDGLVARYFPGQDYYCTREPRHDELRDRCEAWRAEGKIVITLLNAGQNFFSVQLN